MEEQSWPAETPIELEEGDMVHQAGDHRGGIKLSQTFKDKLDQQSTKAVEVKLLGRRIGYQALSSSPRALWKPLSPLKLVNLEQDFFLVRFIEDTDYLQALTDGPWLMHGQTLSVQWWVFIFRPKHEEVARAVTWIHFPDLPIDRYQPKILTGLGNLVGAMVKIDEMALLAHRGHYVCIAVDIDLNQPLKTSVELDGEILLVEYKGLLNYVTLVRRPPMQLLQRTNINTVSHQSSSGRKNESFQKIGSRYSALIEKETVEVIENIVEEAPQPNNFMGLGHRMHLMDFLGSSKQTSSRLIFKTTGPKQQARTRPKGQKGIQNRLLQGESSRANPTPEQNSALAPQVQI
ncbi:hypothetical protein K2173_013179 [Erythroxylum novogranatense]|uniref:DUF4283 domain-containing protein n=1 Tax=Erythroxylum novogranatense TaxID=1862640 RepID=A0AAV8TG88_9ROSI|nr:hypothetical protein K2173_013179 [Erythroxylum novogranatense]